MATSNKTDYDQQKLQESAGMITNSTYNCNLQER